jgi:hypothetical protein
VAPRAVWSIAALFPVAFLACSAGTPPPGAADGGPEPDAPARELGRDREGATPTWDLDQQPPPALVTADYIDSAQIARISLFRSSMGHDYWDSFERCRSMKHYFIPRVFETAGTIAIRAPLDAEVVRVEPEWAGVQLHLRSRSQPAFTIILFHVALAPVLAVGDRVDAGQPLGTHIGGQTASDVAVAVDTPGGRHLISYFDIMDEATWAAYAGRGLATRQALIITREERDADPLQCDGERFLNTGTLPQTRDLN